MKFSLLALLFLSPGILGFAFWDIEVYCTEGLKGDSQCEATCTERFPDQPNIGGVCYGNTNTCWCSSHV